jgi:putative membrane protein
MNESAEASIPGIQESDPRVQLATERTLLAWIRTGLAFMAFGFVVARFALILQSLGVKTDQWLTVVSTLIGIIMLALGVTTNAMASLHYRKYFRRMTMTLDRPFTASSLAIWVALASALIGVLLIVYLVLVDLASWESAYHLRSRIRN